MKDEIINIEEFKIMSIFIKDKIKNKINKDILDDNDYLEYYKLEKYNLSEIEKLRVESDNTSIFLKKITDTNNYSKNEIFNNLKNCLYNKKACIFSCGYNLTEHSNKFYKIENDNEYLKCCWKSSCNIVKNVDILGYGGTINNENNYFEKNNSFKILIDKINEYNLTDENVYKNKHHLKIHIDRDQNGDCIFKNGNIYINYSFIFFKNKLTDIYTFIRFIKFLGIKEFYLFGFYIDTKWIDIRNYNYYEDIISEFGHYYDIKNTRIKELGSFIEQIMSSRLHYYINVPIYNVSQIGCLSNNIPRIDFECIFKKNKTIIKSKYYYEDIIYQLNNYFDINFYIKKHNLNYEFTEEVIYHYLKNICLLHKISPDDNKEEIYLNDMILQLTTLIPYILKYGRFYETINKYTLYSEFFAHYLLNFNNSLNVCFYKDYKIISTEQFWNNLLVKNDLAIKNINIVFNNLTDNDYKNTFLNNNKYFKLLYKIFILNNIPHDFNFIKYKELNVDLQHKSDIDAIYHYNYCGYKENRSYKN